MSRVTAPISKLARTMSSASSSSVAAARSSSPLLDSTAHHHHGGAVLMPKYAELLRSRSSEHTDSSRGLTTTARPSTQPNISNRPRPLMQTFHSSAARSAVPVVVPTGNLDTMVLPDLSFIGAVDSPSLRMPLLPDNYGAAHIATGAAAAAGEESTAFMPTIVAADPEKVSPSTPLSAVEGINMDSIELKFVHEAYGGSDAGAAAAEEEHSHMLKDLWKGMVDDVLGPAKKTA